MAMRRVASTPAGRASSARRKLLRPPSGPLKVHSNTWLTSPPSTKSPRTALVLLNTPPRPVAALRQLWALSSYRVCADAAANRLRDSIQLAIGEDEAMVSGGPAALRKRLLQLQQVARQHESMVPDAVTGDFDSIRQDVLDFYRKRGCLIRHDPSQNSTDFEKALALVEEAQARHLPTAPPRATRTLLPRPPRSGFAFVRARA